MVVPLTRGKVALIDDASWPEVSQYKWSFDGRYACTCVRAGEKYKKTYMHHLIVKREPGMLIDHINMDRLDNRLSNLRIGNKSQNAANMRARGKNLKGTSWNIDKKKWSAKIMVNYKRMHLGYFKTQEEAHAAYCKAASLHFGEFARAG